MQLDEKLPARRSIRLPHFDYTQTGQYFITVCTFQMHCLFGQIENDAVVLSDIGRIARDCWLEIPNHFSRVVLDPFVVMPNHVHGIVAIEDGHGSAVPLRDQRRDERSQKPVPGSIPTIVRSYKAAVTYRARHHLRRASLQIWQSNYFERVLRRGKEFEAASRYILENPKLWHLDKANVP